MSSENRKIGYYGIDFKLYRKGKNEPPVFDKQYFEEILKFINSLPINSELENHRVEKLEKEKKSYFLEKCEYDKIRGCYKIIFKSCKYGHCPPYMDSETGMERETSKKKNEGEAEKTHFCVKFNNNEAFVLLEERRSGIGISRIIKYFNNMNNLYCKEKGIKKEYIFQYSKIASNDFIEALSGIDAIKGLDIYTNKKILGDEALGFMNEEDPFLKEDVVLQLKPKPKENLLYRTAAKIYTSVVSRSTNITRVRVYAIEDNNRKILDSDFCRRSEGVEVSLDLDGTINSESIFKKMMNLLEDDE